MKAIGVRVTNLKIQSNQRRYSALGRGITKIDVFHIALIRCEEAILPRLVRMRIRPYPQRELRR